MTRLVYFAWVRERIGKAEEDIVLPETVRTVSDLLTHLTSLGEEYEAALQFPLQHPSVMSVIPGGQRPAEVESNRALLDTRIPAALWADLKKEGLMRADAPTT